RLDTAAGLQAEHGASVVDEVELDVAASSVLLELLLGLGERIVLATADNGQVGREEGVAALADEGEGLLRVAFEVIEEDPADSAGLVAMRKVEILVAPLLQTVVVGDGGVFVAGVAPGAMEVNHVLAARVEGGQIGPAAEPRLVSLGEIAEVGVDGGHVRVARVQDERNADGGEGPAFARDLPGEL